MHCYVPSNITPSCGQKAFLGPCYEAEQLPNLAWTEPAEQSFTNSYIGPDWRGEWGTYN